MCVLPRLLACLLSCPSTYPDICRQFEGINSELLRNSTTSQEIVALKRYLAKIPGELMTLNEAIADVKLREEFLLDNIFDIPDEDFRALLNAYEWPKKIKEVLNIQVSKIDEEYARFEGALKKRVAEFQTELDGLAETVRGKRERQGGRMTIMVDKRVDESWLVFIRGATRLDSRSKPTRPEARSTPRPLTPRKSST